MIEDDLNKNDKDNEIYEDTNGDPIEEWNGVEATWDNYRPRRENTGNVMNRINISLDGNYYGKYVHMQFLMKYYKQEMHDITSYMTVATEAMFTQISAKAGIKYLW